VNAPLLCHEVDGPIAQELGQRIAFDERDVADVLLRLVACAPDHHDRY
jgi:hypothetical protein